MFAETKQKLQDYLQSILAEANLQLVDLTVKRQGKISAVTVLADRPQGGITIDECTAINRRLITLIDQEQLIFGDYSVEVSSPGLDRPLKTKEDFLRVKGHNVRFYLSELVENKREHVGIIKDVTDNNVIVEIKAQSIALPLDKINKAVQEI